ncbi:hypothetical protein NC653_000803 [Populus alba x Populus x berolinensis]|uniref:Uncharacterized protein n=1 Tax=Populus alba x Populus x berolinensis TaxID=444605 RepID=A0AAD6RJJ8_9ROSI|nr:hypothetical protein NC653_000803 [Populus alba x Populus x berolinensis]
MVTNGDVTSGGGWVAGRSCWWSVLAWRIFYDGDLLLRRIGDMVVDRGEKGWERTDRSQESRPQSHVRIPSLKLQQETSRKLELASQ